MIDAETRAIFQQEAEELIESLQAGLLSLERSPDDMATVGSVFRDLHTLKGTGAMFGFDRMAKFIHDFEAAFDRVRSGAAVVTPPMIEVSLRAHDLIVSLLIGEDPDAELDDTLRKDLAVATGALDAPAHDVVEPPVAPPLVEDLTGPWRLKFFLPENFMEIGGNPIGLLTELRDIGGPDTVVTALTDRVPPIAQLDETQLYIGWEVILPADVTEEAIDDVFLFHRDRMEFTLTRDAADPAPQEDDAGDLGTFEFLGSMDDLIDAGGPEAPLVAPDSMAGGGFEDGIPPMPDDDMADEDCEDADDGFEALLQSEPLQAPAAPVASARVFERPELDQEIEIAPVRAAPAAQMRVSAERLDDIMDKVGELVIAEARLAEISDGLQDEGLKGIVEDIQRLAFGLRDTTMAIRMTPLGSITGRFHRLARDLAAKTGKAFDFIIEGEQTELDKTVIEKLSDPLVHLLRNAVDHGLEAPKLRLSEGKPERGCVRLSARYSGADVLISVSDDGKGLDPDLIRARAIQRGIISADANLSRSEIYALVMAPGFSTANTVTELSGRGVGTDVVKQTVESLRGSLEIDSVLGQGATFTLRLPLTLAIMEGLLLQVGKDRYAVPLAAVHQILELPPELKDLSEPVGLTEIRETLSPVLNLRALFNCSGARDEHPKIVVVQTNKLNVGLVVDRIIGSYQTVIKQLSPLHSHMKIFSGATILGDGTAALIIDVSQLVMSQRANMRLKERAA
ncbi:chemotaxis protein CheA [Pseudoprimorskyibacter insulae]|uniref:Chemotaxis protein CheA n=1 Tax=Pseudoprimorskyibacter insulae TaxID=1695997 RepID=A0A2R8ANF6_9RHOB|nr:chemotaxis protein CheA [Pseudoprimorskyibacter insulae]SPF77588.1 Chemotaxis protein CheA [Pseudoprimorskyibacter insulae]